MFVSGRPVRRSLAAAEELLFAGELMKRNRRTYGTPLFPLFSGSHPSIPTQIQAPSGSAEGLSALRAPQQSGGGGALVAAADESQGSSVWSEESSPRLRPLARHHMSLSETTTASVSAQSDATVSRSPIGPGRFWLCRHLEAVSI